MREESPGPVLGNPRRGRQLWRRHPLPVPPAPAGWDRRRAAHPAGDSRSHCRFHRRSRGCTGGAIHHRQCDARPADADDPAEQHGKLVVLAMMVYAGDTDAGSARWSLSASWPLRWPTCCGPMRYPEMFPPEEGEYHPPRVSRTMFMDHIGRAEAETILEFLQASDSPMRVAQLRVLGGAMARVPVDATAYAHRQSRIMANLASLLHQGRRTSPSAKTGSAASPLHSTRAIRARTSTSWMMRASSACAPLTQGTPGTGCGRSNGATTRRTFSALTRISRRVIYSFWSRLRTRMAISYVAVTLLIVLLLESLVVAVFLYIFTVSPVTGYWACKAQAIPRRSSPSRPQSRLDGNRLNPATTFEPRHPASLSLKRTARLGG
jgi:hypothetical protein